MSSKPQGQVGSIMWMDLTIPNATEVRDFYQQVVGRVLTAVRTLGTDRMCVVARPGWRSHGAVREEMTARRRAASGIR